MNDKLKHFLICGAISLVVLVLFAVIPHRNLYGWDKGIAIVVGCLAALGKELVWDEMLEKGTPELYDFLSGVWGAFSVTFAWIFVETIIILL